MLATAVALANTSVTAGFRRLLPHINRIGGGLLVLVGAYVGYYGIYELRLYLGDGDASDPVIEAVGAVQQNRGGLGGQHRRPAPARRPHHAGPRRDGARTAGSQQTPLRAIT